MERVPGPNQPLAMCESVIELEEDGVGDGEEVSRGGRGRGWVDEVEAEALLAEAAVDAGGLIQ